jgi:hypothetical protein
MFTTDYLVNFKHMTSPICLLQIILGSASNNIYFQAVQLLKAMNWDMEGPVCYSSLSAIVNHLLRQPLNAEREGMYDDKQNE